MIAAVAAPSAPSLAAARNGVLRPSTRGALPPTGGRTFRSSNWSGYAVTSKSRSITAVASSFTVPQASTTGQRYASNWAGIGGFRTSDLIQAGSSEFTSAGKAHYFAWYELLPAGFTHLHGCTSDPKCTVHPGDQIAVHITEQPSGQWKISVSDGTLHWSWSKTVHYHSSRSSAEWILEAPTVGGAQSMLPHLTTSFFGPTSTFRSSGTTKPIAQGNPVTIDMVYGKGLPEATPSALASDHQSFNDCTYSSSCAAP